MHQQTTKVTNSTNTNGDDERAAYQDGRSTHQARWRVGEAQQGSGWGTQEDQEGEEGEEGGWPKQA